MFDDIFKMGFSNYTFYAHNTGKFDSHFIVNSLLINKEAYDNYDLKLIVGDSNEIIELAINRKRQKDKGSEISKENGDSTENHELAKTKKSKRKKTKKGEVLEKNKYGTIRLQDSYKFIPESLNSIAKDMLNLEGKDKFPHSFVKAETIDYKGEIPENKYYLNLNNEDYLKMVQDQKGIWSMKENCLKYLQTDLDILYEAMIMFAKNIYQLYGVNLRQRKTISGLALLIYQSNFLGGSGCKIPLVRGGLEKYFRSAYYGGNVNIAAHHCDEGYIYDMNSQYPNAMLKNLPVGDKLRLMSISKDNLKDCFGLVYAEIQSPKKDELRVAILPRRLPNGQIEIPHNSKWTDWYSSEELLNSIKYGYKISPKIAINMDKGQPFNGYVNGLYKEKQKATEENNKVLRKITKLLLNTLYGRMGMRNEFFKAKIVKKQDLTEITKLRT
jgi:hypothetical protein